MLFTKTQIQTDFARVNKLIYSFPKTGKTTFAACQHDADDRPPLFIATEDGHSAIEVHAVRVTAWDGFMKLVDHLEKNASALQAEHSCLIIDHMTDLDAWCARKVAAENHVKHLADMEFGKGFALARQTLQDPITRLMNLRPVTFIAHSAEKEVMWNGDKIKTQAPSMSKGALEFVNGKVDLIMWLHPATTKHEYPEFILRPGSTAIAGSRFPQLCRNFRFDWKDPAKTYAAIQAAFHNPTLPETPEQAKDEKETK